MPSVSRRRSSGLKLYPQWASFLAGADYSKSIPPVPGSRRFSATSTSSCRRSRTRTRRRSSTGSMRSCRRFSSDPCYQRLRGSRPAATKPQPRGGTGGERIVRTAAGPAPGTGDPRSPGGGRVALPHAGDRHPRALPYPADLHGGVGQRLGLDRERQPVRQQRALGRAGQLPAPAHDAGSRPEQLRDRDPQQRLLRPLRRPDPDCGRALPGRPRDAGPAGRRVLPHRVLLPVGDELRRDHRPLPLPLRSAGRDQQAPVVRGHQRGRRGSTTRAASSTSSSGSSAWTSRRRRSRTERSSASATGTGCRGRASPCASFVIMAIFTTSGTFMLSSSPRCRTSTTSVNEAAALDGASEWRSSGTSPSR